MVRRATALSVLLVPWASSFVLPTPRGRSLELLQTVPGEDEDPKMKVGLPIIDTQDWLSQIEIVKNNVLEGEVGGRGEAYAAAQFALLLCIACGAIPLVGDFVIVLLGPGLMLAGIAAIVLSIRDLGNNLSPWPAPSQDGKLVQEGIYAKLRHPQYAGLLATSAGFSIVTGSASRLLLTAGLFYVFSQMAKMEEYELTRKYSNYTIYKQQVPGKFFPEEIVQLLPWNQD